MGFYGDILKILAHTGLQTGGNILSTMITAPMIAERQGQQKMLEALMPTMSSPTASEEERKAAAGAIEKITKTPWPTAPMSNAAGTEITSSEGAKLTAPRGMNLAELAPEYSPTMGLVRPPGSLEQMKVAEAQRLTPEERKTAFFPKDATLQAAWLNAQANRALRESEGEANRASREAIAKGNQDLRAMFLATQQQSTQQWRDFLKQHMTERLQTMTDDKAKALAAKELSQLTSLEREISMAPDAKTKEQLQTQANQLIQNSSNPVMKQFPLWTKEEVEPGSGYFGTNIGGKKKTVPVGGGQTTTTYQLPKGGKMVPVSKEVYDAYVAKYGVPK